MATSSSSTTSVCSIVILTLRKESAQVVRTSTSEASWAPPLRGVPGFLQLGGDPGGDPDTLEGLYPPAGLGTPRDPPEWAGKCCGWERSLGLPATRPRIRGWKWMDAWWTCRAMVDRRGRPWRAPRALFWTGSVKLTRFLCGLCWPIQPREQGSVLLPGNPAGGELLRGQRPRRNHRVRSLVEEGAAPARCSHHR